MKLERDPIKGQEEFGVPTQQDLDSYLQNSKKSLKQMKHGSKPHYFKPERRFPFTLKIASVISVAIVFILLFSSPMINNFFPTNNTSVENTSTTTTQGLSTTTTQTTTIPEVTILKDYDITKKITNLISFSESNLDKNSSTEINPLINYGILNTSRNLTIEESIDLILLLEPLEFISSFNLSRKALIIENFNYWSVVDYKNISFQLKLKLLQSLLPIISLSSETPDLNKTFALEVIDDLWEDFLLSYDNTSNTFTENSSFNSRNIKDQILALQVLHDAYMYNRFDQGIIVNRINLVLDHLDKLSENYWGVPDNYFANMSRYSTWYHAEDQINLYLIIDKIFRNIINTIASENILLNLNKFLTNFLINVDWSCSSDYNWIREESSTLTTCSDQALLITLFAEAQGNTNFAKFCIKYLIDNLELDKRFVFSSEDSTTVYLLDQIKVLTCLLETNDYITTNVPSSTYPYGTTGTGTAEDTMMTGSASSWSLLFSLLGIVLIWRRIPKNRRKHK